jgi:hypothetical protein
MNRCCIQDYAIIIIIIIYFPSVDPYRITNPNGYGNRHILGKTRRKTIIKCTSITKLSTTTYNGCNFINSKPFLMPSRIGNDKSSYPVITFRRYHCYIQIILGIQFLEVDILGLDYMNT